MKNQKVNIKKWINYLSFLLLYVLFFIAPVQAQDKGVPPTILSVSPVLIPIGLFPDAKTQYPITLTNELDTPLPIQVSFADFRTANEDGGYSFVETKTDPLLSWVSVDQDTFILQAKEKKDVILTIKTPKTIPFGGYYGMMYFEPLLPQLTNQTKILAKIAVLMLGSVGTFDPNATSGQIMSFTLPMFVQENQTLSLLLRVKNTSINHFSAKPFLKVKPVLGNETEYALDEKYVFPGKIRRWQNDISPTLSSGMYTTTIAVSIGNGKQLTQTTTFFVYPKTEALAITGLTIILLLSLIYRKRVRKAIIIFFSKQSIEQQIPETAQKLPNIQNDKKRISKRKKAIKSKDRS